MGNPKSANIWRTADRRAKRSEIWASWVLVTIIWGTFDLLSLKVILGSIGALCEFESFDDFKTLLLPQLLIFFNEIFFTASW